MREIGNLEERGWTTAAIVGGLTAGGAFAGFEMAIGALQSGAEGLWLPLRMISAIVLGAKALQSSYPLLTAAIVGLLLHAVLSVIFALIFSVVERQSMPRSGYELVLSASGFGCVLWIVNFYVIAPVFAWVWFPDHSHPLLQFVAHTFVYGGVLGLMLMRQPAAGGLAYVGDGPPRRPV